MFLIVLIVMTAFSGCKDQKEPTAGSTPAEKKRYFPVLDFLKGQIRIVDSLPSAILKITIEKNRKDSAFIQRDEFNKLAQEFAMPALEQNMLEKNFKENSFIDQTTQSATFNYIALNDRSDLQRVDVLAGTDELQSKVKSVFIQESMNNKDTIIVKKLYWQSNKRFQIITIMHAPGTQNTVRQLLVIWDAGG